MTFSDIRTRRRALLVLCAGLGASLALGPAIAHGGSAGDVKIEHPYATPTPPGAQNGAAYIVALTNSGTALDRLLKAASPVAQRTELHTMAVDGAGVMRMREVQEIPLPPGQRVEMKRGMGYHIMLIGLKQPLKEGDSFALTLEFERGGKAEVKVVVQNPAGGSAETRGAHTH